MLHAIPNYSDLRAAKIGYNTDLRSIVDAEHPLHSDPLVDVRDFGFDDATSYYAKPNPMTGEPVEGVPDAPLARYDVVKRLQHAEHILQTDGEVREALGVPAHLRIEDAIRPLPVQQQAYDIAWPAIIRKVNPEITDEELAAVLPKYIAKPNPNSPHVAGGAVDVRLINLETGEPFDRGHMGGAIKGTAFPDFHENYHLIGESDIPEDSVYTYENPEIRKEILLGRRVLHWAMNKAGLYVNPTEIWHYGRGDALSAFTESMITGKQVKPYYGQAELPDWYKSQLNIQSGS